MIKLISYLFVVLLMPVIAHAQVWPAEGASLHYRIIGFSLPKEKGARHYTIQIAKGVYNIDDSFQRHASITISEDTNKIIGEVPAFGENYTWRYLAIGNENKVKSPLFHFSTQSAKWIDEDSVRLRVMKPATAHKEDYVFLDGNKALYDMDGNPVWYTPAIDKRKRSERPRDIKLSNDGTLTFLLVDEIYELSYDGAILWKGPAQPKSRKKADSTVNHHHHEFTKLANGHYMTLGFDRAWWPLSFKPDSLILSKLKTRIKRDSNNKYYQGITFAVLLEYDAAGKIVWSWNISDYFKRSDLAVRKLPMGLYDLDDTHANAFHFDEKRKEIVLSFRNLNRVLKIEYPSGKVLNTYGRLYDPAFKRTMLMNKWFCGQHCSRISQDGYLYVFNNNICHPAHGATLTMLKDAVGKKDSLEVVWEFECPMEELTKEERSHMVFNTGGSVYELADKSMFCCMGSGYGKSFIVNRDKEIVWEAQPEIWKKGKWARMNEYRGSMVTRKELEQFIWTSQANKRQGAK